MACNNVCKLCRRLVISQAVTFADGVLTINLPAGSYNDGENTVSSWRRRSRRRRPSRLRSW